MSAGSDTVGEIIARTKEPEGRISRFFSPNGRIGVRTYLTRLFLACVPILFVIGVLTAVASPEQAGGAEQAATLLERGFLLLWFAFLIVTVFYATMMGIRRVHDLNLSGWFYLVNYVPIVGSIFAVYMSFAPGKVDENDYGEFHEPTTLDKVVGGFVIVLSVLALIGFVVLWFI